MCVSFLTLAVLSLQSGPQQATYHQGQRLKRRFPPLRVFHVREREREISGL